jgi:hypothetical protein
VSLPFGALPDDACRFEVGGADVVADYLFCGQPAIAGKPYCAAHMAIAYQTIETDLDQFRRKPPVFMAA